MYRRYSFWGLFILILLINISLISCRKPDPIAFGAKVGMQKKQVEKLLGEPLYSGGFVASVASTEPYTPQRDRFLLFYVYPDSSLIVFKRDTVIEIYGNVRPYKERLIKETQRRNK